MKYYFFILLLFFSLTLVFSYTASDIALDFTYLSNQIDLMKQNSLPTTRVNDEFYLAKSFFLDEKDSNSGFELTKSKLEDIRSLINLAFITNSDYKKLFNEYLDNNNILSETFYNDNLLSIEKDLNNGRYELASEKISNVSNKILEAKSFQSRAALMSRILSKSIFDFFIKYYYIFLIIILVPLILFFIFKKKIINFFVFRRKKRLSLKKEVILSLMKKLQEDYFVNNDISETSYKIKLSRYSEIEKDLDSEIAKCDEILYRLR